MIAHRMCGFRKPLALAVACALALPLAAQAQTAPAGTSARDQQLEQRVDQLEQELAQLKAMIQAQKAPAASQPTPAAPVQNVAAAPPAPATPTFSSAPGVSVALHGFISASAFTQDKSFTFGNGSNAEFPVAGNKGSLSGVDVRNTRFWLDFSGAKFAGDWQGGGRIEMDFFGGYNGVGAYSQQQPTPRLRQAYMDFVNPVSGTTVRVGQQWELMFPLDAVPESLEHVAFPLGFGTGMVGWRFPGVVVMQDLNHGSDGPKWRLDLGAFEGSWNGPGDNVNYLTAGNASFRPQLEARLRVADKDWVAFAAAHYSQVDLKGVGGNAPTPIKEKVSSTGYELGGSWTPGQFVFKGLAYTGQGLGEIFGALAQFGDITESGGYVQAGYKFTPNWSAYAFYGVSRPDRADVLQWVGANGRLKSQQSALSLQYAAGAYALSLEWMHAKLDAASGPTVTTTTQGNQVSVNGMYKF